MWERQDDTEVNRDQKREYYRVDQCLSLLEGYESGTLLCGTRRDKCAE